MMTRVGMDLTSRALLRSELTFSPVVWLACLESSACAASSSLPWVGTAGCAIALAPSGFGRECLLRG